MDRVQVKWTVLTGSSASVSVSPAPGLPGVVDIIFDLFRDEPLPRPDIPLKVTEPSKRVRRLGVDVDFRLSVDPLILICFCFMRPFELDDF